MRSARRKKVIVDTNCWISFLIGKRLANLVSLLSSDKIELVLSEELLDEIMEVTQRRKFARYFPQEFAESLMAFLRIKGQLYDTTEATVKMCRDSEDDFLLELAVIAHADYLVTGDNDLLVMKKIEQCRIVDIATFEQLSLSGR